MTIALFLGRFQPFHKGHLEVVRRILDECEKIIIVVGSSQASGTEVNPFSANERQEMIEAALESEGWIDWNIAFVPDIGDDLSYVEHLKKLVGHFDVVYAMDNQKTAELFSKAGYRVIKGERYFKLSSTDIRKRVLENSDWKKLVHPMVAEIIDRIKDSE